MEIDYIYALDRVQCEISTEKKKILTCIGEALGPQGYRCIKLYL